MVFKHDCARIVGTCLEYGTMAHRKAVHDELHGVFIELAQSLYARNVAMKLLKHADTPTRRAYVTQLQPHAAAFLKVRSRHTGRSCRRRTD